MGENWFFYFKDYQSNSFIYDIFLIFCPFGLILRKFKLLEFNSESKNNTFWKEKVNKSRTINFKDQF